LEDILEEDDEGLGDQLGEGPGKLSTHIYYAPFFLLHNEQNLLCFYYRLNNLNSISIPFNPSCGLLCTVRTFIFMLLVLVHCTVVNLFKGTLNLVPLHSGQ
jgi:hypothetical protein